MNHNIYTDNNTGYFIAISRDNNLPNYIGEILQDGSALMDELLIPNIDSIEFPLLGTTNINDILYRTKDNKYYWGYNKVDIKEFPIYWQPPYVIDKDYIYNVKTKNTIKTNISSYIRYPMTVIDENTLFTTVETKSGKTNRYNIVFNNSKPTEYKLVSQYNTKISNIITGDEIGVINKDNGKFVYIDDKEDVIIPYNLTDINTLLFHV